VASLAGKVAFVTGSSRGVGKGIALEYGIKDIDRKQPRPVTVDEV
jgi:NAD(P)-dependent dehydrogenase (short-subunit alcohol dehydrogenase family)